MAFSSPGSSGSPSKRGTAGRAAKRPRANDREQRAERDAARGRQRAAELDADPVGVARQICLDQLQHAPRTRGELSATLVNRGVPEQAAREVLDRFTDVGMIDDAVFAQMWVSSRHRGRGLAGRALTQELRRKGVDDEIVREAVETLEPEQEAATARALVQRKLGATRGLPADARVRRLAGLLARKGYPAGIAFRVVREALAQEGMDEQTLSQVLEASQD